MPHFFWPITKACGRRFRFRESFFHLSSSSLLLTGDWLHLSGSHSVSFLPIFCSFFLQSSSTMPVLSFASHDPSGAVICLISAFVLPGYWGRKQCSNNGHDVDYLYSLSIASGWRDVKLYQAIIHVTTQPWQMVFITMKKSSCVSIILDFSPVFVLLCPPSSVMINEDSRFGLVIYSPADPHHW